MTTGEMLDVVSFRQLDIEAKDGLAPIRGVAKMKQPGLEFFFHPECNMVARNDSYLLGRLGFPLSEKDLFTANAMTKRLRLIRPARETERNETPVVDLYCQRCLIVSHSLEVARANENACHFALCWEESGLEIPLCSACLCELYYDN